MNVLHQKISSLVQAIEHAPITTAEATQIRERLEFDARRSAGMKIYNEGAGSGPRPLAESCAFRAKNSIAGSARTAEMSD
jgi:hypothetical protein